MRIKFKTLSGEQFEVECPEDENIETLKAIVITSKPHLLEPKIIFKGKIMKDDSSLAACGITPASLEGGTFLVVHAKKSSDVSGAASAPTIPPPAAPEQAPASTPMDIVQDSEQDSAQAAQSQSRAAQEAVLEQGLQQLMSMGFARDQAIVALQAAFGNVDRAVQYMFDPSSIPTPAQQQQSAQTPQPAPQESKVPTPTKLDVSGGWSQLLGPQLLVNPMSIQHNTDEYLRSKDLVILYLSAHWCPPCKKFTPHFTMGYGAAGDSKMAIIFLSADRDEQSFFSYFQSMPWAATPYAQSAYTTISGLLCLRGIPCVVVCRANGEIVTVSGVKEVMDQRCNLVACARSWRGGNSASDSGASASQNQIPPVQRQAVQSVPKPASASSAKWPAKVTPTGQEKILAALQRIAADAWEVQEKFYSTMLKVLSNILTSPSEQKFRSIKRTVKIFDMGENAAVDCLSSVGFVVTPESCLFEGNLGELHWLHAETQGLANQCYERKQRIDRDERIKEEMDKDRQRQPRVYGSDEDNGRTKYGADRRRGGGGGG